MFFSVQLAQVPKSSIFCVFKWNWALSHAERSILFNSLSDISAALLQFLQIIKTLLCALAGRGHPMNALTEGILWTRPCDNKKLIARYTVVGAIDFLCRSASMSWIWYAPDGRWLCYISFKTSSLVGVNCNFLSLQILLACSSAASMHREWSWDFKARWKLVIPESLVNDHNFIT